MQISKIKAVLGIILVCLLSSITVFAADETKTQELVSNGNIYISEDGSVEKVIRTYADGSFVTEPVTNIAVFTTNCPHPASSLQPLGTTDKTRLVGTQSVCYKKRSETTNRCLKCRKIGIKTYSTWKYYSTHSYSSKKCTRCGYSKK